MEMENTFVTMLFDGPDDYLQIPDEFANRRFANVAAPPRVLLIFTDGRYWYVKLDRIGEHFYLTHGWKQVVDDIPLRINYYLKFTFEDASTVFMDASDADAANVVAMAVPLKVVIDDYEEELLSFEDTVTVRSHFRLPSKLAELGGFYDGMKIRMAYENERARTYKLRCQSNMVTYKRYTIHGWKDFVKRYGIEVGQMIRLTYDFQSNVLFVDEAN